MGKSQHKEETDNRKENREAGAEDNKEAGACETIYENKGIFPGYENAAEARVE